MPFLTREDPNAKVKGSRDPLGVTPIWIAFARHIVRNVTSQSTSLRGFTILVLGRYFTERMIDEGLAAKEDALDIFLRMEQAGAYVRYVRYGVSGEIRGIERVRRFLEEQKGRPWIAADHRGMILSDQRVYGLWGLYSVPARTSGLIPDGPVGVTAAARDFIEKNYLPHLEESRNALIRLLRRDGRFDTRGKDPVFEGLGRVLSPKFTAAEREFYGRFIRDGAEVKSTLAGRQQAFRQLLEKHSSLDERTDRREVLALVKEACKTDEALALSLQRIATLEAFFAPAEALFDLVLTRPGARPWDLAEAVREQWGPRVPNLDADGFAELGKEICGCSNDKIKAAMVVCHGALGGGNYAQAVLALLDWNRCVMEARGGGPWVVLGSDGRLDIRFRGIERAMPARDELSNLWRNTYFIDELKGFVRQLGEGK